MKTLSELKSGETFYFDNACKIETGKVVKSNGSIVKILIMSIYPVMDTTLPATTLVLPLN